MVEIKTVLAVGAGAISFPLIHTALKTVGVPQQTVIDKITAQDIIVLAIGLLATFFGGKINPLVSKFGLGLTAVQIAFLAMAYMGSA